MFSVHILLQEKDNSQVLEEKLKQTAAKMAEYRNQCEILKKEAKIAHKVKQQKLLFFKIRSNAM
jgi:hypothetical protein